MSKHTPGPWAVGPDLEIFYSPNGCGVTRPLRLTSLVGRTEEDVANAHLIAAAPELLDSLERLFDEYDDRRAQFGSDPLWKKWEDVDAVEEARRLLDELKGETE